MSEKDNPPSNERNKPLSEDAYIVFPVLLGARQVQVSWTTSLTCQHSDEESDELDDVDPDEGERVDVKDDGEAVGYAVVEVVEQTS